MKTRCPAGNEVCCENPDPEQEEPKLEPACKCVPSDWCVHETGEGEMNKSI